MADETVDIDLFDPTARKIIGGALGYGWRFKPNRRGALGLAPDGRTTMHVPHRAAQGRARQNAEAALKRWARDHPKGTESVPYEADRSPAALAQLALNHDVLLTPAEAGEKLQREVLAGSLRKKDVAMDNASKTIFSEAPWLAHQSAATQRRLGQRYESRAVMERTYGDGRKEYFCPFDGCGKTFAAPVSVARHYGRQHPEQPAGKPTAFVADPDYTEPLTHREYTPNPRLVAALAEYLQHQPRQEHESAETVAVMALTWMRLRPDLPVAVEQAMVAPLTPEQMIDRISAIVGQPFAGQVRALEEQVDALRAERDEWKERGLAAESDLDTLHELTARTRAARD